jgi:hypothetical protein
MMFSIAAVISIIILWDENYSADIDYRKCSFIKNIRLTDEEKEASLVQSDKIEDELNAKNLSNVYSNFKSSLNEFKKTEILFIGLIESITSSSWGIFFFFWTPVLTDLSPSNHINVGFTYICFVMALIGGAILYEIFIIKLKKKFYNILFISIGIQIIFFIVIVYSRSFYISLISFAIVNGAIGFTSPLFSIIKSNIIQEKFRSQLMSLFRVPLNVFVIILLLLTHVFSPTKVIFYINIIIYRFCLFQR